MKLSSLLLLALFFGAGPYILLSELLLPQLTALEQQYQTMDEVASRVVQ